MLNQKSQEIMSGNKSGNIEEDSLCLHGPANPRGGLLTSSGFLCPLDFSSTSGIGLESVRHGSYVQALKVSKEEY